MFDDRARGSILDMTTPSALRPAFVALAIAGSLTAVTACGGDEGAGPTTTGAIEASDTSNDSPSAGPDDPICEVQRQVDATFDEASPDAEAGAGAVIDAGLLDRADELAPDALRADLDVLIAAVRAAAEGDLGLLESSETGTAAGRVDAYCGFEVATGPGDSSAPGLDLVEPDATIDIGGEIGQVTAAGDDLWIADFAGTVIRVHAPTGEILARIPVEDDELRTIQVTSAGVWVRGATALHRIDPSTDAIVATVPKAQIGAEVTRAFVDETAIWACDGTSLVRAALEDGHPTASVDLGFPCGTVRSADGQVWVASDIGPDPGQLVRVDPATVTVVLAVDIPIDSATFPAIEGGEVWTHGQSDTTEPGFVALDAGTGAVLHHGLLATGGGPGVLTDTAYYAVSSDTGEVLGIDRSSGEVVSRLDGGASPNAVVVSGGSLWVVDDEGGELRRFDL
jgi:hypothetical protein